MATAFAKALGIGRANIDRVLKVAAATRSR
jgi:hypothetical protein